MVTSVEMRKGKSRLPYTPPLPDGAKPVDLTDNARQVFFRRYTRRGNDGHLIETAEETFWRVVYHVAKVEEIWGGDVMGNALAFYDLMINKRFFPNSPTFTGAGTPLGQLAACFVLPLSDDMGKTGDGIFQTLRDAALIQQTGGGNGFSFSQLRPKGTLVKSSAGEATGPVGFLRVYDIAFGEVAQGGTRRGANMAVLRVDHPDIEDFIFCKTHENAITNFNISVGITDEFMIAVENDEDWELRFPDVNSPKYRNFHGSLEKAKEIGIPFKVYQKVRAKELFNKIVQQAHHNGEPGVLFLDSANRANPLPHLYDLEATNPCGEQWLGPYENCCLGSMNLAQFKAPDKGVDWESLRKGVILATRFLDNVVEANAYVPSVPQLKEAAHNARRIGLGIMGLADLMYHTGITYGSEEGQEFGAQIMEFVRFHAMNASIKLAEERGSFPLISGSVYDPENLSWKPPEPITPFYRDWNRPRVNWVEVLEGIQKNGIRNAAQTTIAPTGTIATIAGCEGYGCEPVFALAYVRHVNDNGDDLKLVYTSPTFEQALIDSDIDIENRKQIVEQVLEQGSCQNISQVPEHLKNIFVVSEDITAGEHVQMQAALQAFVDNSLSKTVNFPENAIEDDVATAYKLAWKLGCKGITVYVTGSLQKVVLETQATAQSKENTDISDDGEEEFLNLWYETKKPRPRRLRGYTYNINTPLGKTFVTVNENGGSHPFEIFISTAKAGSDTAAVSEAIGRLLSYILRLASPVSPRERLTEIVRQLEGIGGGRPMGFGPNRVRSLPDGVSQALREYLNDTSMGNNDLDYDKSQKLLPAIPTDTGRHLSRIGDLCPECGQAAVVNEEGCRKCYTCGFSEC